MSWEPVHVETGFPLFPLPLVALPSELVPLHIFEPGYLAMIGRCLSRDEQFGIVWLADDELHEIGCACHIERVLDRSDDGPMNILVRGTHPIAVIERQSHLAYPAGIVRFLTDAAEPDDPELPDRAHEAYRELVRRASDRDPAAAEVEAMDAYQMAATVDLGAEVKQQLLELRSESRRLDLVLRLFRAASKRLEFVAEAQAKAKSNGKVYIN